VEKSLSDGPELTLFYTVSDAGQACGGNFSLEMCSQMFNPEVSEGCFHIKAIGHVASAAAPDEHGAVMAKIAILHLAHYEQLLSLTVFLVLHLT